MKTILYLIVISIVWISLSKGIPFCEIKSVDNVFNIGHLIYMTRCGEVWTYDPRMYGEGLGGFTRDFTIYTFARKMFGPEFAKQNEGKYDNKLFRFAAFSFQEVNCLDRMDTLDRECSRSVEAWNGLTIIVSNESAVLFKYDTEFEFNINDTNNPFNLSVVNDLKLESRHKYWPKLTDVAGHLHLTTIGLIRAALFDVRTGILYIGLMSEDTKYYCLTYCAMNRHIYSIHNWFGKAKKLHWMPAACFTGNLLGMFKHGNGVYAVGRLLANDRMYEDQIYEMILPSESETIITLKSPLQADQERPHNIRTYFGCIEKSKPKPKPTKAGDRKKRAILEQPVNYYSFETIWRLLSDEWTQLALMSIFALILIYGIIHLSINLKRGNHSNKKD